MNKRVTGTTHFFIEEAKKALARAILWLILAAVALYAASPWERIQAIWNSPAALGEIQTSLRELRDDVQRATGEDRVLRMEPGLSYVSEPVRQGEAVILNLVAQRTRLGASCRMVGGVSLFTDESGVTLAGSRLVPIRQIGTEQVRLRIELQTPPTQRTGRTALHMELEYNCAGSTVYDRTEPVIFYLLPAG